MSASFLKPKILNLRKLNLRFVEQRAVQWKKRKWADYYELTFQKPGSDFRALGVKGNCHAGVVAVRVLEGGHGLADVGDGLFVVLVGAVREVETGNVHAEICQQ